jgi:2-polyprenyl-3-methyl-5-hydroxy-6-metoxy-1,4-benzoquinol methylase
MFQFFLQNMPVPIIRTRSPQMNTVLKGKKSRRIHASQFWNTHASGLIPRSLIDISLTSRRTSSNLPDEKRTLPCMMQGRFNVSIPFPITGASLMAERVCPPWIGYFLLNPLRKLVENPDRMFGPFVREGMVVLEPGCAMGFFTLPLARMVGPSGRVIALEIQDKMLAVLGRRAQKAGLTDRIELRRINADGYRLDDLSGRVDFAAAIHVVHEIPDKTLFFTEIWKALRPGGRLLVVEPKGHVSREQFEETIAMAEKAGFTPETLPKKIGGRTVSLIKQGRSA